MKRQVAIFDSNKRVGGTLGAVPEELKHNLGPIIKVSPKQVKFNPKNKDFREDTNDDFDLFRKDIEAHGIHDPILLRPDMVLIAGERRTRAALALKLESMEARIYYGDLSDGLERKFIIRDNLQRRQLVPKRKEILVKEYYAEDLKKDNRGKKNSENLAKKVSAEMNMPIGTAKRIIAKARNPDKEKKKASVSPAKVYFEKTKGVFAALKGADAKISAIKALNSSDRMDMEESLKAMIKKIRATDKIKLFTK